MMRPRPVTLEKVKALIKDNPRLVFSEDETGRTPLHWAAVYGHKDVAEVAAGQPGRGQCQGQRWLDTFARGAVAICWGQQRGG
jgi:ankyrin repeat protein